MRNATILVISGLMCGCSLAVTFDRDRIGDGGGMDASVPPDTGPDEDAGDGGEPVDCDPADHRGCAADELCCETDGTPTCVATSLSGCASCGTACDATAADSCADRGCACGTAASCSGDTPLCVDGECVECESAADCTDQQCIGGQCVDCDPADNAGCAGTTPICNAGGACEGCTIEPDNCPGDLLMCGSDGACTGCSTSTHDGCDNPTTPICERVAGTNTCRGCEDDTECNDERGLPFCQGDGRCAACDPAGHRGCSGTMPVCAASGGGFACMGCTADAQCAGRAATPICDEDTGACVACDADTAGVCPAMDGMVCLTGGTTCVECNGPTDCGATAPRCVSNECQGCTEDTHCSGSGTSTCIEEGTSAGACGPCDPEDDAGCDSPTEPICATSGMSSVCRGCEDGECGTGVCLDSGACADCDPTDNSGCEPDSTAPVCAAGTCVGCSEAGDCAGNEVGPICVVATGRCVECEDSGDCSGDTPICDGGTCRGCTPAGATGAGSAECTAASLATVCTAAGACAICDTSNDVGCAADDGFTCTALGCECTNRMMGNKCTCGSAECALDDLCSADVCVPPTP